MEIESSRAIQEAKAKAKEKGKERLQNKRGVIIASGTRVTPGIVGASLQLRARDGVQSASRVRIGLQNVGAELQWRWTQ